MSDNNQQNQQQQQGKNKGGDQQGKKAQDGFSYGYSMSASSLLKEGSPLKKSVEIGSEAVTSIGMILILPAAYKGIRWVLNTLFDAEIDSAGSEPEGLKIGDIWQSMSAIVGDDKDRKAFVNLVKKHADQLGLSITDKQ